MLDLAYKYENEIKEKFMNTWYDEKYKFYHASSYHSSYECPQDDWHSRHFVSLDDNRNVIGLISYEIDRVYEIANNFGAINFTNNKLLFGRDLIQVIDDIFCRFNIRKIEFSCVVGNPIERSYDRIVKKFGGNIIGIRHKRCKLHDNNFYDDKLYELFREDYLKSKQMKRRESNEHIF